MLNWLQNGSPNSKRPPDSRSAVIRVIGDRASGKTTYMAALARWPNATPNNLVQRVTAINAAGEKLVEQAQVLLEEGLLLEPTVFDDDILNVNDYSLSITLRNGFARGINLNGEPPVLTLNISCKDYPGEFFADLHYRASDPILKDYLEDCLEATGILFFVDGTSHRKDKEYANGLKRLLIELDHRILDNQKRQIAFVLTKCEQSELWVNRNRPLFLVQGRFPQTYDVLREWQATGSGKVECFTTSAFGMIGTVYPKPNAELIVRKQQGVTCVIHDPKRWRPFGLVSPIYWLCTGDRSAELEKS